MYPICISSYYLLYCQMSIVVLGARAGLGLVPIHLKAVAGRSGFCLISLGVHIYLISAVFDSLCFCYLDLDFCLG